MSIKVFSSVDEVPEDLETGEIFYVIDNDMFYVKFNKLYFEDKVLLEELKAVSQVPRETGEVDEKLDAARAAMEEFLS